MRTAAAAALIGVLLSTGCHSMRPIAISVSPQHKSFAGLRVGDLVQLKLTDGTRHCFEIDAIEGDAIVSNTGRRYTRGEIAELARERVDGAKTVSLVTGIVAGGLMVIKILEHLSFAGY